MIVNERQFPTMADGCSDVALSAQEALIAAKAFLRRQNAVATTPYRTAGRQ
jgi:hypothetical protein